MHRCVVCDKLGVLRTMYTIVEETHDVDAITPTLSSKAAEVIIQVEQV